jgi:hypothetical protein
MATHVRPECPAHARRFAAGLAVLILAVAALPPRAVATDPARVVAVGDIHGEFEGFVAILRATGLIDARHRWSGGRATLVQTGDFNDRGDDVRAVMDLLMALEREAPRHGGRVVTLLGNHEVMVMLGDFVDVTPAICASFADGRSESRRQRAWRQHQALASRQAGVFETAPRVYTLTREEFLGSWPPGCLEYREALTPRGRYGAWLRSLDAAAIIEGTLYMHAGASADLPVESVAEINTRVRHELDEFDRLTNALVVARLALPHFTLQQMLEVAMAQVQATNAVVKEARERGVAPANVRIDVPAALAAADLMRIGQWWLVAPEGPMWYRGYALDTEEALADPLAEVLSRLGATHMAVAHTVTSDGRIRARAGGRLFLIDTGMLTRVYNGRPSALDRRTGGAFTAVYLDRRDALTAPARP